MSSGITNAQLFNMLMGLTKESAERDARVETLCENLQMEVTELKKANSRQVSMFGEIRDTLANLVQQFKDEVHVQKSQNDKLDRLFEKTDSLKQSQKSCSMDFENQKDVCDDRFKSLETLQKNIEKPVKNVRNILAKIGSVFLTVTATAVATYFLTKLGLKG